MREYVGVTKRFWALTIDSIVLGLIAAVVFFGIIGSEDIVNNEPVIWILLRLIYAAYYIILPVILGGTIGKRLLRFRIVDSEGNRINLMRSIIRYTPFLVILAVEIVTEDLGYGNRMLHFMMNTIVLVFYIVEASVLERSDRKQSIHDSMASTFVVYDMK